MTDPLAYFSTDRLLGEPLGPQHFDDIHRLFTDRDVMATLGGVRDAAANRAYVDKAAQSWADGFDLWHLRDRETGRFVGRGGLRSVIVEGVSEVEVGYAFLPEFWGQGLATEMTRGALALGFDALGLGSVIAYTLTTNAASRRVMEKSGLAYERSGPWADLPHVFYRIAAEDWRATSEN